jgi:transglutaminase-like putative cysteine protease
MIYDIRHVTTYRYDAPVAAARCSLRLVPAAGEGQRLLGYGIDVVPRPTSLVERADFFGTRVATAIIGAPHRELRITATSRVDVERRPAPDASPRWEDVRREAASVMALGTRSPAHFLYPSRLVPLFDPATAYAADSFTPGRPIVAAVRELMQRVHDDFLYDPKATAVTTPLAEAFAARTGVCQDFAHAAIAGLRGLGLRPMCRATSARFLRRANPGSWAPTPRTPGCRCGAARSAAGSTSTPPTPSSWETTTSWSDAAATMPTSRPSTA